MPEVAGQAAVFFDPLQIDSLMVAMEKVVQSTEKQNSLIRAGRNQASRFSWQRCADETVEVYKKCLLR
jgi:glycosyltransferase involved in cell wall biosynthesis